jgi:RNA polymerase sigma factor (sigma-70 family)
MDDLEVQRQTQRIGWMARRFWKRCHRSLHHYQIEYDDLRQEAWLRILESYSRFNPQKARFGSFTDLRIQGSFTDMLRQVSQVNHRTQIYRKIINFDDGVIEDNIKQLTVGDCEKAIINRLDARKRLGLAFRHLSDRERCVIVLYHLGDYHMREIGSRLGVNESRISQIHTDAMRKLRRWV